MDTEKDGQTAGADDTIVGSVSVDDQSSVVETPSQESSEDTTEQQTGTDDTGQADETGEAPKRKPWWEKRFDELTAKRYEAESQAAYWRGIAEAGPRQEARPTPQDGPPEIDQFETYEEYEEARIAHIVEQRLRHEETARQRTSVLKTYEERAAKFKESKSDYDSIVSDPSLKITTLMAEVIRESDVGPQVAYHLGTNRSEAERIAGLPPHRQAAELGKLEAMLTSRSAAPPSPKPIPPEPPKTVSGIAAGLNKSPEDMSMAEYMQWHNTRDQ